MKEVERIISDYLLDLKGLEKKIEDYVKPCVPEIECREAEKIVWLEKNICRLKDIKDNGSFMK